MKTYDFDKVCKIVALVLFALFVYQLSCIKTEITRLSFAIGDGKIFYFEETKKILKQKD